MRASFQLDLFLGLLVCEVHAKEVFKVEALFDAVVEGKLSIVLSLFSHCPLKQL
jgi:hypothetical protein